MNRPSPIPTAPSRRGFLAVLSASAIAPAALAGIPTHVAETSTGDLPTSRAIPSADAALLQLVDDYLAANTKWRAISAAADRAEEERPRPTRAVLRAWERKSVAALNVVSELLATIECTPALTLAGIVGKAKVAVCEGGDDEDFAAALGVSIARDLLRLGEAQS
jgi:hypothetical protein